MTVTVTSLHIYPVKSCRGIQLQQAVVTPTGFGYDRQWMVVNEKGRMLTIRNTPKLTLIDVSLPVEALEPGWDPLPPDASLSLSAPGVGVVRVPLSPSQQRRTVPASVWEWSGIALDEGDDVARWLTDFLGKEARLVRFDRSIAQRPTEETFGKGYETAFSDGFPFLLISEGSLGALNSAMDQQLPMNRFRPNIVVSGCGPFEEDLWEQFALKRTQGEGESLQFQGVKPCSRCKVTTTDVETAETGPEPLQTLRKFRVGIEHLGLSKRYGKEVFFGMNLLCNDSILRSESPRIVFVGDECVVASKRQSYNQFPS